MGMFPLTGRTNETFQKWHDQHVNQATGALNQTGLPAGVLNSRLAMALHFEIGNEVESLARIHADGARELIAGQLDRLANAQTTRGRNKPRRYPQTLQHDLFNDAPCAAGGICRGGGAGIEHPAGSESRRRPARLRAARQFRDASG